jgi:hypothetical protein
MMLLSSWSKNEMNAIESLACLLYVMLLLGAGVAAQDPPPNAKWRLTKVNFEGLKSQPPEKMIAASGLQVRRGNQEVVDAVVGGEEDRG